MYSVLLPQQLSGIFLLSNYNLLKKLKLINKNSKMRECRTIHSAELNEIFFRTLDELDCASDDLSILR